MKRIVCAFILIINTCSLGAQKFAKNAETATLPHPNIVLIMADDLSMTDIQPYGSAQVHTPNIARLAKEF